MVEESSPRVYAGIIDEIGRRLYSGKITWLREYIQNAIDSGTHKIHISLKDNDLELFDQGKGMDKEILIKQAFSIGKSFKDPKEIGELGIGMYAGSGICDVISVLTKMKGKPAYIATVDMHKYREILKTKPDATFEEVIKEIFHVEESNYKEGNGTLESFTKIKFAGLSRDTFQLIEDSDLPKFLEFTVNLPISNNFKHRQNLMDFLNGAIDEIDVDLEINGTFIPIKKFDQGTINFTDSFWSKDIIDESGKLIGKIWAIYNKSGTALENARILVKRKGITVGDETYVSSKFFAKYSPRFFGEIILLDDRIEINTTRDWFVESTPLENFVKKTKALLNELYEIANFDSEIAIRLINLVESNNKLEKEVLENEKKGNTGIALQKKQKIDSNEEKIKKKLTEINKIKKDIDDGKIDLTNPTNKIKAELIDRTLSDPSVSLYIQKLQGELPSKATKKRKSAFPAIVITFLKQNIIDRELANRIGNGDVKDTTNRAFTFVEQKLREKVGKKENERVDWRKELLPLFKKYYRPPDYKGFSPEDQKEAFTQIMDGLYTFLRNPSNHTFMDDINNPRNLFEILMIADFLVNWIDQWEKI